NTPYYDTSTQTFDPNGSPKVPVVSGLASFEDSFTYTGLQGIGYKVNYLFHIDDTSSGPGSAVLNFRASDSATTEVFQTGFTPGPIWATDWHDVVWGLPMDVNALFFAGFGADLSQYPE